MSEIINTKKIDYISVKEEKLRLVMVEDRVWDSDDEMYVQLQDKLSNYIYFIESGQLYREYPDSKEYEKVIRLDSLHEKSKYAEKVIKRIDELLTAKGIGFEFCVLEK